MGTTRRRQRHLTLLFAMVIGAGVVGISVAAVGVEAQHEIAVTCTNPVSGANWKIKIDYDRKTVDSNPASITESKISWRDAKDGGNYTLDRKSGKLTVIIASSTAGHFLYDDCEPQK